MTYSMTTRARLPREAKPQSTTLWERAEALLGAAPGTLRASIERYRRGQQLSGDAPCANAAERASVEQERTRLLDGRRVLLADLAKLRAFHGEALRFVNYDSLESVRQQITITERLAADLAPGKRGRSPFVRHGRAELDAVVLNLARKGMTQAELGELLDEDAKRIGEWLKDARKSSVITMTPGTFPKPRREAGQ